MNSTYIADTSGVFAPQQSNLGSPAQWFLDYWRGGAESDAGVAVTSKSVLGISAGWYCINLIGDALSQMPLGVFSASRNSQKVSEDKTHPGGRVMRIPSETMTAFHLRKTLMTHALIDGNGRALIEFNGRQEPQSLIVLDPKKVKTVAISNTELGTRQKWHVYFPESGEPIPIPDDEVLHIFRTSLDGMNGVGVVDMLKNPIGLTSAGDKDTAYRFKNHGVPSLLLEAPPGAFRKPEDAIKFLDDFNERHSGTTNAGRVGMLRDGIKANVLGAKAIESQLVELREFQVREIMRVFGVPVIPGVADSQSYNSLEQLNRALLIHCFGPWMEIWTQECAAKLLTRAERRAESYYFAFDSWDLVKPDASQLGSMISNLRQSMIITGNEGRAWIDLPPHSDGDTLQNPMTTSAAQSGQQQQQSPSQKDKAREIQLVAAKLEPLIRAEATRVAEMAKKARNFLNWMEEFYAKHESRLSEALASIGGEAWIAKEYCDAAKLELLDAATGSPEGFSERIEAIADAWKVNHKTLAERIVR